MMTRFLWIALFFICVTTGQIEKRNSTLIFLHILFRHGYRSPLLLYPDDPNPPQTWIEGLGQLTQLGRKQQYVLGKYLRSRYSDFVTSNPNEILVNSSEHDRCVKSALSNLASFYAPAPEWAFEEGVNWQPITVHYSPLSQDKYLSMESDCPRFVQERDKSFHSSAVLDALAQFKIHASSLSQSLIEALKIHGAFEDLPNYPWAVLLQNTVTIEKENGLPVAPWIEAHWAEIEELSGILINYVFDSLVQQRLRAGPILEKMIENMDDKIAGKIPDLKVQMFSAHDLNIVALLQALQLFNKKWPNYCATLLFELHERPPGLKEVRILYLNSTRPEDLTSHVPHVLQLEGCSEFCPLDRFRAITRHLIPDDWDLECQL